MDARKEFKVGKPMPVRLRTLRGRHARAAMLVEALESRICFDLSPISVTGLPVNLIATVSTKDMVTVNLKNTGLAAIHGPYTVELFASPDGQMADATPINTKGETLTTLHAGQTRPVKIGIGAFPNVTTGNYFVLAEIQGSLAGVNDSTAVSTKEIDVATPFVDLSAKIAYSGKTTLIPTQSTTIAVTVYNFGNVPAKGPLEIDVGVSLNSDGSGGAVTEPENVTINLLPGQHTTFHFGRAVAIHTQPDLYYATVSVDPENTFSDPVLGNNTGVTFTPLTVLDPYADIQGTDFGAFTVTKGPDKRETGTLMFTISQESNTTGVINGLGTDSLGNSFAVNGTFGVNKTIVFNTNDLSTGTIIVYDGTVSKNKITGTFHETTGDDIGTFSLTF